MGMLYELDEVERKAVVGSAQTESDFERIFREMEAPDYPVTCNGCGLEGTNASLGNHACEAISNE